MTVLKSILLISIITVSFPIPSFAQTDGVAVKTLDYDHLDCGKWIDSRSSNRAQLYEYNILGFINGYAVGTRLNIWGSEEKPISDKQVYLWLDKYCRKNPMMTPYQGVNELFLEIFSN